MPAYLLQRKTRESIKVALVEATDPIPSKTNEDRAVRHGTIRPMAKDLDWMESAVRRSEDPEVTANRLCEGIAAQWWFVRAIRDEVMKARCRDIRLDPTEMTCP